MKILGLHIENFGKFHDFKYDFNGGGIEILYGENEFGKTTIISFIQRIFYGFPDKRHAENMYESAGTPYGGRLFCIANDGRYVTLERLGTAKGGTLRIFDSRSGEDLNVNDYVRQGAEFYRNIYMIHLKDLLSEASLSSDEVRGHLYGIERAFGSVSPLKIQTQLNKNCSELYLKRGASQIIPKLAKELKLQEKNISELNDEISSLADDCRGTDSLQNEIASLKKQISTLENFISLQAKYDDMLKKANSQYTGILPDEFLLKNQAKTAELFENHTIIANDRKKQHELETKIQIIQKNILQSQFSDQNEFDSALSQYELKRREYQEILLRTKIEAENYAKQSAAWKKILLIMAIAAPFLAVAGAIFKFYYAFFVLLLPLLYLCKRPAKPTGAPQEKFIERDDFFHEQKNLLLQKTELAIDSEKLEKLQKNYDLWCEKLKFFAAYLPEKLSDNLSLEITTLHQKMLASLRDEAQFELFKKNQLAAKNEAEKIKNTMDELADNASPDTNDLPLLKNRYENLLKKHGEITIKQNLTEQKIADLQQLQNRYFCTKNLFNQHCRNYLKWKTALNIWEKTISIFEKNRQGEVMQNASKYFAQLTSNPAANIRKPLNTNDGLVVFDGQNDKTIDKLSSGTREQLLFVIRLALIEYIEKSAPCNISMPLLMDDIFVNYDKKRECAAWDILKKFAENRQIIFCCAREKI